MEEQQVETTIYSLADAAPAPPQCRTDQRQLSLLRVGALTVHGRRELCLIRNISAGGMMIRAYSAISPGTRLSVELKRGESVSGTAKWAEGGSVGVAFDVAIDIVSLIAPADDGLRPRMPRVEVNCTAWVREGADVHRVTAVNISQGGLCVDCADALTIGAEVIVTLTGFAPLPAVVKWRVGENYGITFNRVLSLADLVGWLQGQRQAARRAAG